jgi:hypothetical protein
MRGLALPTGKVIASLADPSGLQAGTTGAPFSS